MTRSSGGGAVPGADATPLIPDNGFGGLTADGDYEIRVSGDRLPPAPWSNVIANPHGGFVVTERGRRLHLGGEQLLLPAHALAQRSGERSGERGDLPADEETGELWSATPAPVRVSAPYTVRHGAGASTFEHQHEGIATTSRSAWPTTRR